METEVQAFYKNKTIFITGATGFLGKVIIEKLLRSTDVNCIYALTRPKKEKAIQDRINTWKKEALFEVLLKSKPDALERVHPIAGDCRDPDLGISDADRTILATEVQVVLHCAATVRFNEPMQTALPINTRATRQLLQLAKQMRRLEAFVHVSTAYSNCVAEHIDERFYPEHLNCTVDKVLSLQQQLSNEMLENITPALLGKFPNTYTYTKALAEQLIETEAGDLPVCVYRPGIIIASYKEPVSGWVDNLYGPISLLYGCAFGVLRVALFDTSTYGTLIPVDFAANLLLVTAWKTALDASKQGSASGSKPIYNYVSTEKNGLTWGDFRSKLYEFGFTYPLPNMIWYPFIIGVASQRLFTILNFIYHIVPGYFIDLMLRLRGKRPRMIKLYDKIHTNVCVLKKFSTKTWQFDTYNTDCLWECMSPRDKQIFDFNMSGLDWSEYFKRATVGMRIYLGKEEMSTDSIERGKKALRRFRILHYLLQVIIFGTLTLMFWYLFRVFGAV